MFNVFAVTYIAFVSTLAVQEDSLPDVCGDYLDCTHDCNGAKCTDDKRYLQNVCTRAVGCICKPGLIGSYCDEPCESGKYGIACKKSCKCSDDVCNKVTGCPDNEGSTTKIVITSWKSLTETFDNKASTSTIGIPESDISTFTIDYPVTVGSPKRDILSFVNVIIIVVIISVVGVLVTATICYVWRKRRNKMKMEFSTTSTHYSSQAQLVSSLDKSHCRPSDHTEPCHRGSEVNSVKGYTYIDVDIFENTVCSESLRGSVAITSSLFDRSCTNPVTHAQYDEITEEDILSLPDDNLNDSQRKFHKQLVNCKTDSANGGVFKNDQNTNGYANPQVQAESVYHVPQHWEKNNFFAPNYDHVTTDNYTYNHLQFSQNKS